MGLLIMRNPPKLDQAILRTRFTYKDGELYRTKTMQRVGGKVCVGYHQYPKENVIYTMHHNTDFERIDHIDGDTSNNKLENLAPITEQEYQDNRKAGKYFKGAREGVQWSREAQTYFTIKEGKLVGKFKHGDQASELIEK